MVSRLAIFVTAICAASCVYHELPRHVDCSKSDIAISVVDQSDASNCKSHDGQITVAGSGGQAPYKYSLGDDTYQTSSTFDNLGAGYYIIMVMDFNECMSEVSVSVAAKGSTLAGNVTATPDTECFGDTGSISVTPVGGTPPYTVKLDDGAFDTATNFTDVSSGPHNLIIKDSNACESFIHVHIAGNTGVSYSKEIVSIFTANCTTIGCHNSSMPGMDWTKFSDVKMHSDDIRLRTQEKSMPPSGSPSLTKEQIQVIGCWVDDGANNN